MPFAPNSTRTRGARRANSAVEKNCVNSMSAGKMEAAHARIRAVHHLLILGRLPSRKAAKEMQPTPQAAASPRGAEDDATSKCCVKERCACSGQALARQPRRLSPHEFFAIRKLHLTSLA